MAEQKVSCDLSSAIQRSRRSCIVQLLVLIAAAIVSAQPCAICIRLVEAFVNARYVEDHFCTAQDEVFQTIKAQHEKWLEYFSKHPFPPVVNFAVSHLWGEQTYVADAGYWIDDNPLIFVRVESAFKREILGSKGYFISPTGNLPGYGIDKITHLEGVIYCYTTIWF